MDRGALLTGPPGTGKTTFAKALANSCGVPLVSGSYAQWQAANSGHLGDLLRAMRATFKAAKDQAPSILFLDEFDSFHNRSTSSRNLDWWTNIVGALLELLDGLERRDGVVVVAATNHPELVDPALKRAGRLDRIIEIPLPNQAGLVGILRSHLCGDLEQADLMQIAALCAGRTGADVEKWVRGARRRARQAGTAMTVDDLVAEIVGADEQLPLPRRLVSVHEAGHALLLAMERPGELAFASIARRAETAGEVVSSSGQPLTSESVCRLIRSALAGRAAEYIVFGEVTGGSGGPAGSDLGQATRFATAMETALGLSGKKLMWSGLWSGPELANLLLGNPRLARRVNRRLDREWRRAVRLIRQNRRALNAIAAALEQRHMLSGSEVEAIVAQERSDGGRLQPSWIRGFGGRACRLFSALGTQ